MAKIPTAWSYSAKACYDLCPRKYKYQKVDKLPEPKSPAMARGIKIHNEAAKFLAGETDTFPVSCAAFRDEFYELRDMNPIVEQKWAFTANWKPTGFFAKDVRCRVITDACAVYSDATADVIDHKTGKRYDDDYTPQLGLFAAATIKLHPTVQHVTARLWYLDADEEVIMEFTKAEAMEILAELEEEADHMLDDREWVPNPNPKCRFCHWRKSNGGPCEFG